MTTHNDMVYALGGVPTLGGGSRFYGWWGKDCYFVDYDDGADGYDGKSVDRPKKNLLAALEALKTGDVVYVKNRPMESTDTNDAQYIASATTTNFHTESSQAYVAIIGAAPGSLSGAANYHTYLRGAQSSGPVLEINGYGTVIENLAFHRGSVTAGVWKGLLTLRGSAGYTSAHAASSTGRAQACIINNCLFRWYNGAVGSGAAVTFLDQWYSVIMNSHFYNCMTGIEMWGVNASAPRECQVRKCTFSGDDASIDCNIYVQGSNQRGNLIEGCHFANLVPAGGSYNKYIQIVGSDLGGSLISDCYFNDADVDTSDYTIITSWTFSGCWDNSTKTVGAG